MIHKLERGQACEESFHAEIYMNIYRVALQNRRYIKGYLYELFLWKIHNNNSTVFLQNSANQGRILAPSFYLFIWFVEIGFLCVAVMTVLEFTNSEICLPLLYECWD